MRLSAIAVLLPLVFTACHFHIGGFEPRVWVSAERAFEVDPAALSHVSCLSQNGDVTVLGSEDGNRIVVRVKTRAGGEDDGDAAAALDAIEILHKRADSGLALGWRWRQSYRRTWRASVSFDITMPQSLPSKAETYNGDVRISGLAGSVSASSHNGDLWLHECAGDVRGSTHNGDVDANVTSQDLSLVTHNGRMQVVLDGVGPVRGELRSHNGGIRLGVAEGRTARLVCNTANGRVTCNRTLERMERGRRFLVADFGSGEGRLAVETHNGSIRIE